MSGGENSSGEECSLRIDTDRRITNERVKPKGTRTRGKGRGRGRGGARGCDQQLETFKPGDVVWAKVTGFNFWPGMVC